MSIPRDGAKTENTLANQILRILDKDLPADTKLEVIRALVETAETEPSTANRTPDEMSSGEGR